MSIVGGGEGGGDERDGCGGGTCARATVMVSNHFLRGRDESTMGDCGTTSHFIGACCCFVMIQIQFT